jgi:hypothetical protein
MSARSDRSIPIYLFVLFSAIYLLSSSFRIDSGDGEVMYRVAESIAAGNGFAVAVEPRTADSFGAWGETEPVEQFKGGDGYGLYGKDGRYYAKYGLGWSLAAAPFYMIASALSGLVPGVTEGFLTRSFVMMLNPLLTAGSCVLFYLLARKLYELHISITLTVLFGFGTIAWYYAKSAFSEPLVMFLLLAAILAVEMDLTTLAGFALGGMILTRQTAVFIVMPVLVWAFYRWLRCKPSRWFYKIVVFLLPLAFSQLITWTYNYYRFGDILEYGYQRVGWDTPLLTGLYSLLLSPGKGLLIFSPVLLLGIIGWPFIKRKDLAWLILGIGAAYLLPHAMYRDWSGGGGWGPRLLLPIIPVCLLPSGMVIEKWKRNLFGRFALVFILAVSMIIQVLGISMNWARHLQRVFDGSSSPSEYFNRVHYSWVDSPIVGQVQSLREASALLQNQSSREVLAGFVNSDGYNGIIDRQSWAVHLLSFNVPDFWFVYFWFLQTPLTMIILAIIILGILIGAMAVLLQHSISETGNPGFQVELLRL